MNMIEGIQPGTEMRHTLVNALLDKGVSMSELLQVLEPMYGKSEEEKEAIAQQALKTMGIEDPELYMKMHPTSDLTTEETPM